MVILIIFRESKYCVTFIYNNVSNVNKQILSTLWRTVIYYGNSRKSMRAKYVGFVSDGSISFYNQVAFFHSFLMHISFIDIVDFAISQKIVWNLDKNFSAYSYNKKSLKRPRRVQCLKNIKYGECFMNWSLFTKMAIEVTSNFA